MALLEASPSKRFDGVSVEDGDIVPHLISEGFSLFYKVHTDEVLDEQLAIL